jgi:hypothetical protein
MHCVPVSVGHEPLIVPQEELEAGEVTLVAMLAGDRIMF